MKNILILSEDKNWKSEIADAFNKNKSRYPIKWSFVSTRADVISELSMHSYDAIILNSGQPVRNLEIIFKYLASLEGKSIPVFFISERFSEFYELLDQTQFPHLHLISAPIESQIVAKNISSVLFLTNPHGPVDPELKINLEFLKTYIDAAHFILENFCHINEIQSAPPYLLSQENANDFCVEGGVYLKSTFFEGILTIGFDKPSYISILNRVLEQNFNEVTSEHEDFAGEIVNMVYGQAKTILNLAGHDFEKVIPSYTLAPPKHLSNNPIVVVPMQTDSGVIELLIEIINIKN